MNKIMFPKIVVMIFYELNECDQQPPWVWPVDNETF